MKEKTKIQSLSESLKKDWGEDENTSALSYRIGNFLKQFSDDTDLGEIFFKLISNFDYFSNERQRLILKEFYKDIYINKKLEKENTVYSTIEDSGKINSSNTLLEEYKVINEIGNHFTLRLNKLEGFEDINVIFFDDIVGSGKTILDFFDENIEVLRDQNLYVYCFIISKDTLDFVKKSIEEKKLKCEIIPFKVSNKAFAEKFIFAEDNNENRQKVFDHEISLWGRYNNNILGFKQSEALVAFSRNTPNNTLSTFWFEKEEVWNPLFPRKNDRPFFKRKANKKKVNSARKGYG